MILTMSDLLGHEASASWFSETPLSFGARLERLYGVALLGNDFGARLSGHLSAYGCASFLLKVIKHTVNEAKQSNERRPPPAPVLQPRPP